jgi:hypothetical protein
VIRIGFAYLDILCSTKIISKLWTDDKAFCSPSDRLYRYYTWSISIVYCWDGYRTPGISIRFLGFSLDFRDFTGFSRDFEDFTDFNWIFKISRIFKIFHWIYMDLRSLKSAVLPWTIRDCSPYEIVPTLKLSSSSAF